MGKGKSEVEKGSRRFCTGIRKGKIKSPLASPLGKCFAAPTGGKGLEGGFNKQSPKPQKTAHRRRAAVWEIKINPIIEQTNKKKPQNKS